MKKLLSLPPNIVDCFHGITGLSTDEYFCTCDPVGHKLGSGGGTAWLLHAAFRAEGAGHFATWLAKRGRTATVTRPVVVATAALRTYNGTGSRRTAYHGGQW